MQTMTYYVLNEKVKAPSAYEGDNLTTQLVIDFSDTDYESWPKFVDFVRSDGATSLKSLGSDIIVSYELTNWELQEGTLYLQPYAKLITGETKRFSPFAYSINNSLMVVLDESQITQDILDYLNAQLLLKVDKVTGYGLVSLTDPLEVLT